MKMKKSDLVSLYNELIHIDNFLTSFLDFVNDIQSEDINDMLDNLEYHENVIKEVLQNKKESNDNEK